MEENCATLWHKMSHGGLLGVVYSLSLAFYVILLGFLLSHGLPWAMQEIRGLVMQKFFILFLLGFGASALMGLWYQTETNENDLSTANLYLIVAQWCAYFLGVILLSASITWGSALITCGLLWFLVNQEILWRRHGTLTVARPFWESGATYLVLAAIAILPLTMSFFGMVHGWLWRVAVTGTLGWVAFSIVGLTYQAWMKIIRPGATAPRGLLAKAGLHVGLWGGFLVGKPWAPWALNVALMGSALFGAAFLADSDRFWSGYKPLDSDIPLVTMKLSFGAYIMSWLAAAIAARGGETLRIIGIYWVFNGWISVSLGGLLHSVLPIPSVIRDNGPRSSPMTVWSNKKIAAELRSIAIFWGGGGLLAGLGLIASNSAIWATGLFFNILGAVGTAVMMAASGFW